MRLKLGDWEENLQKQGLRSKMKDNEVLTEKEIRRRKLWMELTSPIEFYEVMVLILFCGVFGVSIYATQVDIGISWSGAPILLAILSGLMALLMIARFILVSVIRRKNKDKHDSI